MFQFLFYYLFQKYNGELPKRDGLSKSQAIAQQLEQKIIQLGDMSRLSRDEIIKELGQPSKTRRQKDGTQCLAWKGKRHTIQIFFDIEDRYTHRDESYT